MPTAWPVSWATMILPAPGEVIVFPVGSIPTPRPTMPLANTASGTSDRGITVPATGAAICVTAPGFNAVPEGSAREPAGGVAVAD